MFQTIMMTLIKNSEIYDSKYPKPTFITFT